PGTWKIANVIGQGSFGAIYLGLNMNTGELMAVKELPIRRARDVAELRQEIDILATLEHPNIVKYLGAEVKDADDAGGPALYIMLEYVPGGSVRQLLEAFEKFSESVVRIYGNQILKGLAYLHDNAICHRDIKGANILLDEKGLVKLADFGASCNYELDACAKILVSVQAGTPYFMAPEIMANAPYAPAADVWSFGGVVLQMATGHFPWLEVKRTSTADLFAYVTTHNVAPACPTHFSAELHDFLGAIFDRDADRRPAAAALLRHAFL
ncbi:hypothetical protein AURANDRAFT_3365, partial [Aureococcus anophagefferens]